LSCFSCSCSTSKKRTCSTRMRSSNGIELSVTACRGGTTAGRDHENSHMGSSVLSLAGVQQLLSYGVLQQ
jgi:hypothetical protein